MNEQRHRIRLHGPWECQAVAPAPPRAGKLRVPGDWRELLGGDFRGRAMLRRAFGCPTGLVAGDRVELTLERVVDSGYAHLNGTLLGNIPHGSATATFEITRHLLPRNELMVQVVRDQPHESAGGIVGAVYLEIVSKSRELADVCEPGKDRADGQGSLNTGCARLRYG